jgi:hypothetical protein
VPLNSTPNLKPKSSNPSYGNVPRTPGFEVKIEGLLRKNIYLAAGRRELHPSRHRRRSTPSWMPRRAQTWALHEEPCPLSPTSKPSKTCCKLNLQHGSWKRQKTVHWMCWYDDDNYSSRLMSASGYWPFKHMLMIYLHRDTFLNSERDELLERNIACLFNNPQVPNTGKPN